MLRRVHETSPVRRGRRAISSGLWGFALAGALSCASAPQRLEYHAYPSEAVGDTLPYAVYAPRDLRPDEHLPLVIFLHGGGDGADCFDEAGLGQYLDRAIESGQVPRVVIVVPDGQRGFWENWRDGSRGYRDWVLRELLPVVQTRYHTLRCPEGCHVMGVSMGGYGALRFALLEPGLFASVSALSAPILDSRRMLELRDNFWFGLFVPVGRIWGENVTCQEVAQGDLFVRWRKPDDLYGVRLLIAWGSGDREGIARSNREFHAHLAKHGIDHIAFEFEGPHKWKAWTPVIARALREQVTPPHAMPEARPNAGPGAMSQ